MKWADEHKRRNIVRYGIEIYPADCQIYDNSQKTFSGSVAKQYGNFMVATYRSHANLCRAKVRPDLIISSYLVIPNIRHTLMITPNKHFGKTRKKGKQ